MKRMQFTEEQEIAAVRQMDAGRPAAEVARELGVSKHAILFWKTELGGMQASDARRLRQVGTSTGG